MGRELSPEEYRWPERGASSQKPSAVLRSLRRCDVHEQSKETTSPRCRANLVHGTQSTAASHVETESATAGVKSCKAGQTQDTEQRHQLR